MKTRRTIGFSNATKAALRRMAEQKGESEARVIEEAINWFDRCDRIIKGGRIVSVTVEHLDGTEKVYTVL